MRRRLSCCGQYSLTNAVFCRYVQDLAVSVAQRDKISGLSSTKDASEGDEQEFRLQELVWRRLVLEEARQQVRLDPCVCRM